MFAAFGPLAADMLTGFQNLTKRFRDWATTLSENQQFQEFIQYIRDNGPGVINLIGNLITFLVNVGIAMAPIGSFLVDMTNGFLEWAK